MTNIREPVWEEVCDAAHRDDVDMLDLLGWDHTQASSRHLCRPGWKRQQILLEALVKGSKRTINAYQQKEDISGAPSVDYLSREKISQRLGEEGNLEMIQWIHTEQTVEGLPSVTWSYLSSEDTNGCLRCAAKAGHKHVISWFKERGSIDEYTAYDIRYKGEAEGGRMDVITWLEDNEIHFDATSDGDAALADFVQSLPIFKWALSHNIPDRSSEYVIDNAVRSGCTEVLRYCFENQLSFRAYGPLTGFPSHDESYEAIKLAVNYGYITIQTDLWFGSTDQQFELIRWMHGRNVLHPNLSVSNLNYHSAICYDNLDVLQWAAEKGYLTEIDCDLYKHGSPETIEWLMKTFGIEEAEMYCYLASSGWKMLMCLPGYDQHVIKWNIEPMEWMLQRKWKKSQDEVQRWFQAEHITIEWLMHLWEHGTDK
ncbi:hypothetical protein PROFUN_03837 [Planoprotostelium fungivorum]|uniref:Ankyrin repeat protein n=1 Tax=Planoprotostelium fungivorum TaxID=1890364 RepID=A0A2P6NIC2_9EUKA|nr:hypothetical protein PROFUN_03837 [Planoprotostelium fungivorum]